MSSLVQLIKQRLTEAIVKVSVENPALNREGEPSAEEVRDHFIAALMAELFPEHGNEAAAVVEVPVVEPAAPAAPAPAPEASPVKKKLTKEEKAAAAAEKEAKKAAKEAEKEAKKAAAAAEKEAKKAAAAAEKEAKKAAKAASPKKAAKVALPESPKPVLNVAKIDPTWRKLLKEADKDHAKELEPELLKYLNGIPNAVFNDKPARQHVAEFIESRKAPAESLESADLEVVEFKGKEYYVNPETKRVYEGVLNDEGVLTVTRPVGYVGMAEFKDMELPESE
jgi:hypothetical protein